MVLRRCSWLPCQNDPGRFCRNLTRVDHVFSNADTLTGAYTNDDSGSVTATVADAYATDLINLREQVFSLEETHIFSPNVW